MTQPLPPLPDVPEGELERDARRFRQLIQQRGIVPAADQMLANVPDWAKQQGK